MNGSSFIVVIDEPYHSFPTSFHEKQRARRAAVIAHQWCGVAVWVYLLLEALDLNLIKVNQLSIDGVLNCSRHMFSMWQYIADQL